MRTILFVLLLTVTLVPARVVAADSPETSWSIQVPAIVYTSLGHGRPDEPDVMVDIGAHRSASIRLETAIDSAPQRVRIYVFEHLFADCLVGEGANVCETPVIDFWSDETPDQVPVRSIPIRVDTAADYVLTVTVYQSAPATSAMFLPGVYR